MGKFSLRMVCQNHIPFSLNIRKREVLKGGKKNNPPYTTSNIIFIKIKVLERGNFFYGRFLLIGWRCILALPKNSEELKLHCKGEPGSAVSKTEILVKKD